MCVCVCLCARAHVSVRLRVSVYKLLVLWYIYENFIVYQNKNRQEGKIIVDKICTKGMTVD